MTTPRRMNLKLVLVAAAAAFGMVVTTISYTSSILLNGMNTLSDLSSPRTEYTPSTGIKNFSDGVIGLRRNKKRANDPINEKDATVKEEQPVNIVSADSPQVDISHLFSPYVMNDEFRVVSRSWRIAAERALAQGIHVEHICAVLPEDVKACPPFARVVILSLRIENYRSKAHSVPSYGEMFTVLRDQSKGKLAMYSNADIATVPGYYADVWRLMHEDLTAESFQKKQLERARTVYFAKCKKFTVTSSSPESKLYQKAETLCARDAVVYFENNGGRPAHYVQHLLRFFKNSSMDVDEAWRLSYDAEVPDLRKAGNSMTITRRQLTKANATGVLKELFSKDGSDMNEDVLNRLFQEGDHHPGNDMFVLPREQIPRLLTETPFIHLRPSGFLIGQYLKSMSHLTWRRIMSAPEQKLTFHVGLGTDEWPVRAELQARAVVFEMAHYFVRTNGTEEAFFPPTWCQDANNYREYGTGEYCGRSPGDFCRGNVRLACTKYWHQTSRDRLALNTNCFRISSKGRTLDYPFCEFCNVSLLQTSFARCTNPLETKGMLGGESYKCTNKPAKECSMFPCS